MRTRSSLFAALRLLPVLGALACGLAAAKKDLPDVDVKVLRLSTGDLGARIVAEAANPQHDVIWGWALTNTLDPRITALLEPYSPKGSDKLAAKDKAADGKWFTTTGY